MNFAIMDFFSLPNLSIWVHWCGSWVVVTFSINMRKSIFILDYTSWSWNLSCWSIWYSGVSSSLLVLSVFLEIISISLVLFLTMYLTIMDGSSLPNWGIWVHWWGSWVVSSSLNMWNTCIWNNNSCWSILLIDLHIFLIFNFLAFKWLLQGNEFLWVFYWFGFKSLKLVLKSLIVKL